MAFPTPYPPGNVPEPRRYQREYDSYHDVLKSPPNSSKVGLPAGRTGAGRKRDSDPWIAEYVWCSGQNTYSDLRSKYMTVTSVPISEATPENLKVWNFDGSSTGQAAGETSEIVLKPVAVFPHPFLDNGLVVLAECYTPDMVPHPTNTRSIAAKYFAANKSDEPWFGLEQEYFIFQNGRPYGWPEQGFPQGQGDYYCGNSRKVVGRGMVLEHYQACLAMGLKISGVNAEVAPAQWEFQIGPCVGIEEGDHMLMARWVWSKLSERYNVQINYDPKPIKGDWNGSGCHHNFSTKAMRESGGYDAIKQACENLGKTFVDDIKFYGGDNNQRMTGMHETSKLSEFTWSIGGRHTSVRVGNDVEREGKGYMEDRRPASNIDPYLSTVRLFTSAMGYKGPTPEEAHIAHEAWWDELANESTQKR